MSLKDIKGGEALRKFVLDDLKRMQEMSLEDKITRTKLLIKEWYDYFDGKVAISFSGGKDSTVLLHIARQIYPDIPAVYFDTGLEYPEIREHVKTFDNVEWMKPKKNFKQIILEYGYPCVSKEVSQKIYDFKRTKSDKLKDRYLNGVIDKNGKLNLRTRIPLKWRYLIDAPFDITHKCCYFMKKSLSHQYEKKNNVKMIVATTTEESALRTTSWILYGCNAFNSKKQQSRPMSFWTEQDILQYIKEYNIPIAKVYGDIILDENGKYKTTGVNRTGCMFCMYGVQYEESPNRFEKMKITHPKQYEWCMRDVDKGGLGLNQVLNYMKIPH